MSVMSTVRLSLCVAIVFLQVEFASGYEPVTTNPNYNRILAELESNTVLDFVDVSLMEAMEQIAEQHNINVVVDEIRIAQVEGDVNANVDFSAKEFSLTVRNIRLSSALKLYLKPRGLDYTIEDEVLKITTAEDVAHGEPQTLAYDVAELLKEDGEADSLAEAVQGALPGSVRQTAGVSGYRNLLLVTGNRGVHESVREILRIVDAGVRE